MPIPNVTSTYLGSNAAPTPNANALRVIAIVGEGSLTFQVTERVTRSANPYDVLAHSVANVIRVGNFSTTTDYLVTTNYTFVNGSPNLTWVGGAPSTGATYYVTYTYDKTAAEMAPKLYSSFDDVLRDQGPVRLDNNGDLEASSYLTMAAQIAMSPGIGATQVILAQIDPTVAGSPTAADFTAALDDLVGPVSGVNPYYIVPLGGRLSDGDVASVNGAYLNHAVQMADPQFRKERRIYTGQKNNATYNSVLAAAASLGLDPVNASRLTMIGNFDPQLSVSTNEGPQTVTLDGFFAAVAVAAFRSGQQVAKPALNKAIPAFNGFATSFTDQENDGLNDGGVTVLEVDGGTCRLLNDVTVNTVNDIESSIPTVETRDDLIKAVRSMLKANFLGLQGSPTIPAQIEQATDTLLDTRRSSGDIQSYSPSKASLVPLTSTRYTVSFSYFPAGEVLQINVAFSIDLSLA